MQLWMIHPNIMPQSVLDSEGASGSGGQDATRPPRAEYLATLSRHSAAVNVVRFSPNGEYPWVDIGESFVDVQIGELIASAGDGTSS